MANKTPVWYEAGFGVYGGDDTIHHLYTENTGNILTLDRTTGANTVFEVKNYGEARIRSVTGATAPTLEIDGLAGQDFLKIDDDENSDHILSIYKATEDIPTGAWSVNFKLRDSGTPQNADVALRLIHDIQTNSPPQGANLLSMGYTNATEVYQELFRFEQSGDAYLMGSSSADLLWDTDGGGSIGGSSANRPANVYASTAVFGGGTKVQTQELQLGPAADTDKTITAQQSATSPYIKYVNGSTKWQFSNDGVTPLDFGTSNVASWDDVYDVDPDGVLTIDTVNKPFEVEQTSVQGRAVYIHRDLPSSSTDSDLVKIANIGTTDDQNALFVEQSATNATYNSGYAVNVMTRTTNSGGVGVFAQAGVGATKPQLTVWDATNERFSVYKAGDCHIITDASVGGAALLVDHNSTAQHGIDLDGPTGPTARALDIDANWGYGLYSSTKHLTSIIDVEDNLTGFDLSIASGGLTSDTVIGYSVDVTEDASDTGSTLKGVYANFTSNGGSTTTYGTHITGDWDRSIYTDNPAEIDYARPVAGISLSTFANLHLQTRTYTSGQTAGSIHGVSTDLIGNSSDTNGVAVGTYCKATKNSSSATFYGIYLTSSLDYGLYSEAPTYNPVSLSSDGDYVARFLGNSSGVATGTYQVIKAELDPSASDTGGNFYGVYASCADEDGSATRYGFIANAFWTYGVYSTSKVYVSETQTSGFGGSTDVDIHGVNFSSMGSGLATGNIPHILNVKFTGNASDHDAAYVHGVHLEGSSTSPSVRYGVFADVDWDRSIYANSSAEIDYEHPTGAFALTTKYGCAHLTPRTYTSGQTTGTVEGTHTHLIGNANDTGGSAVGHTIRATKNGSASTYYGLILDSTLDQGFYSTAPKHHISNTWAGTGSTERDLLLITADSSGLNSNDDYVGIRIDVSADGTDASTSGYYGIYTDFTDNATATTAAYGLYIGSGYGYVRVGKATYAIWTDGGENVHTHSQADGFGGVEFDIVRSHGASTGTGLDNNDYFSMYRASCTDDADDSILSRYYGFIFSDNTANGNAIKLAFSTDSSLEDTDYGIRLYSGLVNAAHTFDSGYSGQHATITSTITSIASASDHDVLRVVAHETGVSGDTSELFGVRSVRNNSYAPPAMAYGFHANSNWNIGYYADNCTNNGFRAYRCNIRSDYDNMPTVDPSSGAVDINLTSSGITTATTRYGVNVRYARNGSDSRSAYVNLVDLDSDSESTSGINDQGVVLGDNLYAGIVCTSQYSSFTRTAAQWNSSTEPVLKVTNDSTTESTPQHAVEAFLAETNTDVFALCAENSGNSSTTQGSAYKIGFHSSCQNRRQIPLEWATPDNVGNTAGGDYYYRGYTNVGYWYSIAVGNNYYISFPVIVPHRAVIKRFAVRAYGGGGTATGTNLPLIELRYKTLTTSTYGSLVASKYGTTTSSETIISDEVTHTMDNTSRNYIIRYRNVATGAVALSTIYGAYVEYEITDFAAGCGW